MKFASIALLNIVTLILLGCGYGSMHNYSTTTTSSVQMTQLSPNAADAGGPAFMLTINGNGFAMNSTVYWNSTALATRLVTGNQVVATVPASDIAMPETVQIYVNTGGMNSNMMNFMVN